MSETETAERAIEIAEKLKPLLQEGESLLSALRHMIHTDDTSQKTMRGVCLSAVRLARWPS